jgi:LDH2 family malate/lactate/ureidoglycolate dehydrogenase
MGSADGEVRRVPPALLREQSELILRAWGVGADAAATTAAVLLDADLKGISSHGISMLDFYERLLLAGQIAVTGEPSLLRETTTTALIDGGALIGHPTAVLAMKLAIAKAEAQGLGAVAVRNAQHFGAAGTYAEMAARRGLIAMVTCSTRLPAVVPTFGTEPMLGTNPFAFAAPGGRHPPVILDMATSVVPGNRVRVYALEGRDIPPGWVVDADGRDVTDAALAWKLLFEGLGGGLAPLGGSSPLTGGHKGYGLALFAQILGSTLAGASFSPIRNRTQKPSEPDNIGHFFLVLNPAAFRPLDDFQDDLDAVLDTLRACPRADPDQPVLVPGDPEWRCMAERETNGVPVERGLLRRLREIADAAGAAWLMAD